MTSMHSPAGVTSTHKEDSGAAGLLDSRVTLLLFCEINYLVSFIVSFTITFLYRVIQNFFFWWKNKKSYDFGKDVLNLYINLGKLPSRQY